MEIVDARVTTAPHENVVGLTPAQQEVWRQSIRSTEVSMAHNGSVVLRLGGHLDVDAVAQAVAQLTLRHQALRATISPDGAFMRVQPPDPRLLRCHDLRSLTPEARAQELAASHADVVSIPFDLAQGPLFRATLSRLGDAEHELLMSAHHVVCDAFSWTVIVEELGRLLSAGSGVAPALEAAPAFADFAATEAVAAAHSDMQPHIDHWLQRFGGGTLPVLDLPPDRPRPAARTFNALRAERFLDHSLVAALGHASATRGASLHTGLLSGLAATLYRLTAQEDIVVGIPASGQLARDMPGLVGHCANLLPLRLTAMADLRFEALLASCHSEMRDALAHQALPFSELLGRLPLLPDPSRVPLVSVVLNVEPDGTGAPHCFAGLDVRKHTIARRYENFELFLNLRPLDGGLLIEAQYNSDLFDEVSVLRWLDMYEHLLRAAVRQPSETVGRLELLSSEAVEALHALQTPRVALRGAALAHAGFMARVPLQAARPAVRDGARSCSYGELDAQSNQLARALRARGVGRGQFVGLCLERSLEMVISMIGILKAGAAYVPLDPAFPPARLDHYASDAALSQIVTNSIIAATPRQWRDDAATRIFEIDSDDAWRSLSADPLPPSAHDAGPEDAAYVIYTSGSTGLPKGVVAHHRGVAHLLQWMEKESGIHYGDRIGAVTTLSFDMSVPDLLLPLAAGAELIMVQREVARDGERLAAALEEAKITLMQATPGMWQALIDAQWRGAPGFRGWTGGEALRPTLARALCERMQDLWNGYGPTETTVKATAWRVRPEEIAARGVSIGRPVDNTEIWILDANLRPCPIGVPGEICIAGEGVTIGYLHRPELTAERFVTVDILGSPKRIYRSGDRGRWCNDGLVDHLGRLDFQLKVRGYRIEPGEIEARCCEVAGVSRSVVVAREDRPGDVRLVAYLGMTLGAAFDLETLMGHLRKHLPVFMLPQHVVTLDALPVFPNGKTDRAALPPPQALARENARSATAPRDVHERKVLAAMEKVLGLQGLDVHDDFFGLGGHSLLAGRLTTALSREFAVALPLRTLFEAPTVAKLAAQIHALQGAGVGLQAPIERRADRTTAPLTMAQERIRFMEELHPGRSVYNTPSAQRLKGKLDQAIFEGALREVIHRQPALRTRLGTDAQTGPPLQFIDESVAFTLPLVDLRALPADQREAELADRMQTLIDSAIDLHSAPMAHATLYRLGEDEHVFLFVPHHLVWDGWSFDLLQNELAALYDAAERGQPHNLAPLSTTLGDYAEWLAQWTGGAACEAEVDFWRHRLAQSKPARPPSSDFPRRAGKSGHGGGHRIEIDLQRSTRLREIARGMDVTLSMLTFGVYALTIAHATGNDAIVIANPMRGRNQTETDNVMGFFNNVVPVALSIDLALKLPEFMRYVKQELLSIMNNQQVPFERLMAEAGSAAQGRSSGPYQALFSFQDMRERPRAIGSLQTSPMHVTQNGATDDIGVWLTDTPEGLQGTLIYNADVFLRETGAQLRARYLEVLNRVLDAPHDTLAQIASPDGSPSAHYLRKLTGLDDEKKAAAPARNSRETQGEFLDPNQLQLARIWAEVIGIDVAVIREEDNFFELGGDSLLVMRAVQQAHCTLAHQVVPRRYLFESLGQLADVAPTATRTAPPDLPGLTAGVAAHARKSGLLGRTFSSWLGKN